MAGVRSWTPSCRSTSSGANKPRSLQNVRTDSGIVFAKDRPFVMSVMTAYDRDERAAERAIGEIALETFRYFEMRG
jgi:hypothetical protein